MIGIDLKSMFFFRLCKNISVKEIHAASIGAVILSRSIFPTLPTRTTKLQHEALARFYFL